MVNAASCARSPYCLAAVSAVWCTGVLLVDQCLYGGFGGHRPLNDFLMLAEAAAEHNG